MTNRQIERLLERVTERVPRLLDEKGYKRDTCILHTRVAVDLLRHAGLRAAPLAVQVAVFNPAFARWANELGRMPTSHDDMAATDGAWAVHIGYGADPRAERPGFDGHVIATVNGRYALDLTIDQASRPQKGIVVGPHWWIMDDGFAAGGRVHAFRTASGAYLRYEAMPEERAFLNAGDWRLPGTRFARELLPSAADLSAVIA